MAKNTAKGLNLVVGAEFDELEKALKEVNTNLSKTENELKNVDKLLKLDPKNTVILSQKQEALSRSLKDNKDKLEALKQAKAKADEMMAIGTEINKEEYRRLQREIVQTEQNIKDLTKANNGFIQAGEKLKTVGNKFSDVGKKTIGISAGIVASGIAAIKSASDVEESMNKVDVAFDKNADKVKEWSQTTLTQFGISKGSALEMASLFGDMGTAMNIPTDKAADMSTSLVGLAGDLSSFKNISLDVAQNALKGIFTGEGESLKSLGVIMNETTLSEYALSQGIKKKYKDMSQAEKVQLRYNFVMSQTKNAQGDFARTSDGVANGTRILSESLKELSANFGEKLLPKIAPLISKINEIVQMFANLDDKTQNIILIVAGVIAIIPPLLIGIGSLITAIGTITTVLGGLNLAFVVIIAVIVAVVAAFVILWNKCDAFRNFWINLWNGIVSAFKVTIDAISNFFTETLPNAFNTCIDFVKNNWKQIVTFFINPFAGIFSFLYKLNPKFKEWVDGLITNFKNWFGKMKDVGKNLIEGLWNGITDKVSWLKDKVSGVVDKIKGWFTGKDGFDTHSPSKWAQSIGEYLMSGFGIGILAKEEELEETIKNVLTNIKSNLAPIYSYAVDGMSKAFELGLTGLEASNFAYQYSNAGGKSFSYNPIVSNVGSGGTTNKTTNNNITINNNGTNRASASEQRYEFQKFINKMMLNVEMG